MLGYSFDYLTIVSYLREFGIPDDKMAEIQDHFIKLSYDEKPSVRQAAVWALGELNVHRQDAYLTVVRRLIDDHNDTREEAKRVLKNLTGILGGSSKSCVILLL